MTISQLLRSLFFRKEKTPTPPVLDLVSTPVPGPMPIPFVAAPVEGAVLPASPPTIHPITPTPSWLQEEENLRDEGVLFGLSEARPDGKIAEIRAYFGQQAAPLVELVEHHTESIGELNLFIEQRENRIASLRNQLEELTDKQPAPVNLIRTALSLTLSVVMCLGNYFLISETLQPSFANPWIAIGVFLAGMFNLFGRTSFFYETSSRLTGRRLIEELGLPLAASVFVLIHASQTQTVASAIGLFIFVFFLFLLAGKLLLSTVTALQTEVNTLLANRRMVADKHNLLPRWETEIQRLTNDIDALRAQKWPIITALNHAQANLTQLNTHRDRLVNLFMSEFELARSLRGRLTEQQREELARQQLLWNQ